MLLANHGPLVAGKDLEGAVYAIEEPEETAKLHLFLGKLNAPYLSPSQVSELAPYFDLAGHSRSDDHE